MRIFAAILIVYIAAFVIQDGMTAPTYAAIVISACLLCVPTAVKHLIAKRLRKTR